jgi:Sec-independent protein secretion pathway component TatC
MNWRPFFDFREMRGEPKPFLDHIEDLRIMLIKMLVVLGLMMGAAFAFQKTVAEIIERPLLAIDPDRTSLTNFGVADPLTIASELSFYARVGDGVVLPCAFSGRVRLAGVDSEGKAHAKFASSSNSSARS